MNPRQRTLHHARRLALASVLPVAVTMAFGCDPMVSPPTCANQRAVNETVEIQLSWLDEAHSGIVVDLSPGAART